MLDVADPFEVMRKVNALLARSRLMNPAESLPRSRGRTRNKSTASTTYPITRKGRLRLGTEKTGESIITESLSLTSLYELEAMWEMRHLGPRPLVHAESEHIISIAEALK